MNMHMSGTVVHMEGNWTMNGLSRSNLNSLASALQQIEPGSANTLRIDCEYVSSIDITGLQLLDVWLRCAKLRGATPELVNTPMNMTKYFKLRDSARMQSPAGPDMMRTCDSIMRERRTGRENR